jgi:hypothetical protein
VNALKESAVAGPAYPSADESRDRLHLAGWSFGWVGNGIRAQPRAENPLV